ncbi:28881_t:CDS:2, partial [Racocetra persica]
QGGLQRTGLITHPAIERQGGLQRTGLITHPAIERGLNAMRSLTSREDGNGLASLLTQPLNG